MDEVKQIIAIRKDLKMSKGKAIAQGAHASMKVILDQSNFTKIAEGSSLLADEWMWQLQTNEKEPVYSWLKESFVKIVVEVNSLEELEELEDRAIKSSILVAKILDEGRTEFNNKRTVTALAIGPEWKSKLEPITGNLKLFK